MRPTEAQMAERGHITWLSSEEDGGPDCGLILGLGGGKSLYVGELANRTLKAHGIDPKHEGTGWWIAIHGPDGFRPVAAVVDAHEAQEMVDELFAALRAKP